MAKFIQKKVAPYAIQQIAIAMMTSDLQRLSSNSKFFPKSYEISFAESHIQILLYLKIVQKIPNRKLRKKFQIKLSTEFLQQNSLQLNHSGYMHDLQSQRVWNASLCLRSHSSDC